MAPATLPFERPAVLRLGEWVVYPRLCRATRAGVPVHLRSQVIDLLVVLSRRPNDIVSKEEVSAALWPGVHVSSSALSRCMAELRQVFEDDPKEPWLVETIAKRGYRLIARVQVEEQLPDDHLPAEIPVIEGAEPTQVEAPVLDERTGATDVTPLPAAVVASAPRARVLTLRAVWVMAILALVSIAAAASWYVRGRNTGVHLSGRETLVLGDVVNTTGDKAFDSAIRLALAVQLEQAPVFRIISDERVRETLALMRKPADERIVGATALEVCRREGAAVVISGTVSRLGKRFALGVEAVSCGDGDPVARVIEQAETPEGVLEAVGKVVSVLRTRLGESQASVTAADVPVARATTSSLEALRAMGLGDLTRNEGRLYDSLQHYREAVRLDPQFAMAWARLGAIQATFSHTQDARESFTKAYQLAERTSVPERSYITAYYHLNVTGELDQATEVLEGWKRLYPGSALAATVLAGMYIDLLGRFDAALAELQRTDALVPSDASRQWLRLNSLVATGRFAEAKQVTFDPKLAADLGPNACSLRLGLAWIEGNRDAMKQEIERGTAAGGAFPYFIQGRLTEIAMLEGRVREARKHASETFALAKTLGQPRDVAREHLIQALDEAAAGNAAETRRLVTIALDTLRNRDTYLRGALALALAGDGQGARRAYDQAVAAPPFSARTDSVWMAAVGALVDGLEDPTKGLRRLETVKAYEHGLAFQLIPVVVRAQLLLNVGLPKEAVAACREYEAHRNSCLFSGLRPLMQVTLARALAKAGETAASRSSYEAFLASWKNADPDVPLLAAARRELAALR